MALRRNVSTLAAMVAASRRRHSRVMTHRSCPAVQLMVWDRGAVTVREVYEAFRLRRPIAYTTVLTTMRILEQ